MIKDFEVGANGYSNELTKDGVNFDLHNRYEFEGVFLNASKTLEIRFRPDAEYGKGLNPLTLLFKGVKYLEFSPTFGSKEILGIDEMGYKEAGDKDDEWLVGPEHAKSNMHFFLRLIPNSEYIRVQSKEAMLVEKVPTIKKL